MDGYAEVSDVGSVLQDDFAGANPTDAEVEAAIAGLTQWARRKTRHHFYDSGGTNSDLIPTGPRTVDTIQLDVPNSPHAQDRQIRREESDIRYPVTRAGQYARVRLPHYGVETLAKLEVRHRDGSVTDWVATSDKQSGRGEDYYLQTEGDEFKRSYLYLHAGSIGPRVDYEDLLTLSYSYGLDQQSQSWDSVRRGVATLAAADIVLDDDIQGAIPDDGQLVPVNTKADKLLNRGMKLLGSYIAAPI
jgi:hypothetical protein